MEKQFIKIDKMNYSLGGILNLKIMKSKYYFNTLKWIELLNGYLK